MNDRSANDANLVLRRLADHVTTLLAYWDRNLVCRFANRAYEAHMGVGPGALVGKALNNLPDADVSAADQPQIAAVLRGEQQVFERSWRGPDGALVHGLCHYIPDRVDGAVVGFFSQTTNIDPLKRTEAALRASETFLDRTGRIGRIGGWELDLRHQHLTWSERTRHIHEVAADYQPTVETAIHFYAPQARAVITEALQTALKTGAPWDLELPFVTAKGRPLWVRACGEVEYEAGRAVRLLGAFQDITEQRQRRAELQHEQALREEVERHVHTLDQLLKERGEMLDVLAHEVRQPLNNAAASLQSAAATLAEFGERVASQRLNRAQLVMGQVLASIDNTLAVATLLATAEPSCGEDADLDSLLAIAIADMPASEQGRVRVERGDAPHSVMVDTSLMRLALRNLLSNALKFSAAGSPVVVRLSEQVASQALIIDVVDTGPGIPPDEVPRLFQRLGRGAAATRAPKRGLGFGLYIVRRVMELHGGRAELAANSAAGVTMRLVVRPTAAD